jgi:hypothetical protein
MRTTAKNVTVGGAGVPDEVQNRDSRSGSITEGRKAGAQLEDWRHRAGHADIKMTQICDRSDIETKNKVATLRVKARGNG